ncbi:type I methionyl aminopeptidase [Spirochaetia bacterium 38H-sp]|uniref:Methionine aminopeptidase n=1 Tax=Rarispira pelagica TaxID=3141764 RepID=A0ABU9UAQ9_9SPIR
MICLKTYDEIKKIKIACNYVEKILRELRTIIRPGISTGEIIETVNYILNKTKLSSSLVIEKMFPLPLSISVNEIAVHGGIVSQVLKAEDILTVDIAICYKGWHGDGSWTYSVDETHEDNINLIRAAWRCTMAGVSAAIPGGYIRDIGAAIEDEARQCGCKVIPDFAGHGIGKNMHESPTVFHYGIKRTGERIVPGMVFTIEPVVTFGDIAVERHDDGFAYIMKDRNKTAQFEHTIAIFEDRAEILTLGNRIFDKKLIGLFD